MPLRALASVVLVVWAIVWIGMGVAIAREVRDLAALSDTVVSLGEATQTAGDALAGLEALPVVGERLRPPAEAVRDAGRDAILSGRQSRRSAERLGLLLGVSVAVIPIVAVAGLFAVVRRSPSRRTGSASRRGEPARAAR